jgi:hypothetical protein
MRIKRNNGHYYYYDFSYKNVIVEYHGKVWHPNPKKDSTDWKSIRGKTYEEALLHDCKKDTSQEEVGIISLKYTAMTIQKYYPLKRIKFYKCYPMLRT